MARKPTNNTKRCDFKRRIIRAARLTSFITTALVVTGCASVPSDRGFSEVSEIISADSNVQLIWKRDKQANQASDELTETLLAGKFSCDAAVQIALLNNPHLQAKYYDLGVSQSELVSAAKIKNPMMHLELVFENGGHDAWDLGINQSIVSLITRPTRKAVARYNWQATKLRVVQAVVDTAAAARKACISAIAADMEKQTQAEIAIAADAASDYARRIHKAGGNTLLALNKTKRAQLMSEQTLQEAELNARSALRKLIKVLGLTRGIDDISLPSALPKLPARPPWPESAVLMALGNSYELAAKRKELAAAIKLSGAPTHHYLAWLDHFEAGIAAEREGGEWAFGPELKLPLPLFDSGNAHHVAEDEAVLQLEAEYRAAELELHSLTTGALETGASLRQQVLRYVDDLLPLQRQIDRGQLQMYNAMQVGAFDLLAEKQQSIRLRQNFLRTLASYWQAHIQLEQILAGGGAAATPALTLSNSNASGSSHEGH